MLPSKALFSAADARALPRGADGISLEKCSRSVLSTYEDRFFLHEGLHSIKHAVGRGGGGEPMSRLPAATPRSCALSGNDMYRRDAASRLLMKLGDALLNLRQR